MITTKPMRKGDAVTFLVSLLPARGYDATHAVLGLITETPEVWVPVEGVGSICIDARRTVESAAYTLSRYEFRIYCKMDVPEG